MTDLVLWAANGSKSVTYIEPRLLRVIESWPGLHGGSVESKMIIVEPPPVFSICEGSFLIVNALVNSKLSASPETYNYFSMDIMRFWRKVDFLFCSEFSDKSNLVFALPNFLLGGPIRFEGLFIVWRVLQLAPWLVFFYCSFKVFAFIRYESLSVTLLPACSSSLLLESSWSNDRWCSSLLKTLLFSFWLSPSS